jgi:N-acetylated-alpha-linked acidic dipeptidase
LGSGSDYTVFVDHLAVASVNASFRGDGGGVYHSIYDSYDWYRRFGDPEFIYGRALAQYHAVAIARMADAVVLPFEFTNLADTVKTYLDEIDKLYEGKKKKSPPDLDLKSLRPALDKISKAAEAYESAYQRAFQGDGPKGGAAALNALLRKIEQAMSTEAGLPGREWYKHQIYAPGFYTGYGVKTIPAIREAIEQDQWETAASQIGIVRGVFETIAAEIAAAEGELRRLR